MTQFANVDTVILSLHVEQEMTTIGKKLRRPGTSLNWPPRCDADWGITAVRRHTHHRTARRRAEQNDAVAVPGPAEIRDGPRQHSRRLSVDVHAIQLSIGEEAD